MKQENSIERLHQIGEIANQKASQNIFYEYLSLKSEATIKAYQSDIELFRVFFESHTGVSLPDDMGINPNSWATITHGLLKLFKTWMIVNSYSIGTINRSLTTIRRYAGLAFEAGIIPENEYALMRLVNGYSEKAGKKINRKRLHSENMKTRREYDRNGTKTRKKANPITLTVEQISQLKNQSWVAPDEVTPQFYRDQLMMCLFLDHGLRCGELANLRISDIDLDNQLMAFYRQKIDETHIHRLSVDSLIVLDLWLDKVYTPTDPNKPLLCGSRKGGKLTNNAMSTRAITKRVNVLGKHIGIDNLSAHDCRHSMADQLRENGANLAQLMDAGGWKTSAGVRHYLNKNRIMNETAPNMPSVINKK